MISQSVLVKQITAYKSGVNKDLICKAYDYAMDKHRLQTRASGDPYFSHPLAVAGILTKLKLDEETIAVALLHDTLEDTDATREEIDQIFGKHIGFLVEGLTKLKRLELVSKKAEQAENLRRFFLAICDDIRILLIKLADRLHNMRTLGYVRSDKRIRISTETMEIYAPLAGRVGMQDMREELENLAFYHTNLHAYKAITEKLSNLADKNKNLIVNITKLLSENLQSDGVTAIVSHRLKSPYSVFTKMERKALGFEQLSDIYGFRIIVKSIPDCYKTLGVIHQAWSMVPNQFKDYISTPKQNDYRSIHTTVVGPSKQRVELQIRTQSMHEIAEYGIAAHAIYKDFNHSGNIGKSETSTYAWLRRTVEVLCSGDSPEDFLEHTKLELFQDQVFCFTPKGALIPLPSGATPVDFAYAVHTDIGNSCVGCKINGQVTPLITNLKNGDEVEIICSNSQTPPSTWESVVVTGKARSAIRRVTRNVVSKQYSGLGIRILERTFKQAGKVFNIEKLKPVLRKLARESSQDVLTAVGRGEIPPDNVFKAIYQDYEGGCVNNKTNKQPGWFGFNNRSNIMFKIAQIRGLKGKFRKQSSESIPIRGISSDLPIKFATKSGAIPGDRIVGIFEAGKGVTIYPVQSPILNEFYNKPDKWLDVRWDIDKNSLQRFPAFITFSTINKPGNLAKITDIIASNDVNIHDLSIISTSGDFSEINAGLEVYDLDHLKRVIEQLRSKPIISKVTRIFH